MTKLRNIVVGLAALLLLTAVPAVTQACDGGGYGNGLGSGLMTTRAFGYSGTLYGLGYIPVPPYFALHPPVYYGQRYFRSYGGSPFARPAVRRDTRRVTARVTVNPFVKKSPAIKRSPAVKKEKNVQEKVASAPRMIMNPFYFSKDEQIAKQ